MSDTSGLKFSTQPLIVSQPPEAAAQLDTIYVQVTGKTASRPIDTSFYNPDGFKYEWYRGNNIAVGSNKSSLVLPVSAGPQTYYAVISNELGSTATNNCVVP
jgi:hypothetical protein